MEGCGCASSPALQPLLCGDDRAEFMQGAGRAETSPRGEIALLNRCYSDGGLVPGDTWCRVWRWTATAGAELLVDSGGFSDMADDGTALLIPSSATPPKETLVWVRPDGTRESVSLSPGRARLGALGTYVVGFAPPGAERASSEYYSAPTPPSRAPLARWSVADGMETLGELPGDLVDGIVVATSPDGSVAVGQAFDWSTGSAVTVPLYWTAETGLQRLAGVPTSAGGSTLLLTSSSGSALAGVSREEDFGEVFHWTRAAGFRRVTSVSILGGVSVGQMMSQDGEVLAGSGWQDETGRNRVYRWRAGDFAWIGPDTAANVVVDMSADGSTVIGQISNTGEGFIWSEGQLAMLADLLVASGIDSSGWQLQEPVSLSGDGSTLFGRALCNGEPVLYRWQLPR